MADKIDQLIIGSTSYDIDLPPDATPSIASITTSGNATIGGSISEGGTTLANKYLGKTAKAADSDLLDGHDSAYFINTSNIASQSVANSQYSDNATFASNAGKLNNQEASYYATASSLNNYLPKSGGDISGGDVSFLGTASLYFKKDNNFPEQSINLSRDGSSLVFTLKEPNGTTSTKTTTYTLVNDNDEDDHVLATTSWVESQGYVTNAVTPSGTLSSGYIIVGNGGKQVKATSYYVATSSDTWDIISDTKVPTMWAISSYASSTYQAKLPTTTTAGKVLKSTSTAGTVTWGDDNNTNYYHTPSYSSGLMIATGTGVNDLYVPRANSSTFGAVKPKAVRVAGITATTGGTTSDRYYGVELDKNGQMFVNVPWTGGGKVYKHDIKIKLTSSSTHYLCFTLYGSQGSTPTVSQALFGLYNGNGAPWSTSSTPAIYIDTQYTSAVFLPRHQITAVGSSTVTIGPTEAGILYNISSMILTLSASTFVVDTNSGVVTDVITEM